MDGTQLTRGQQRVLDSTARRLLVLGGPGSGKTAIALLKARTFVEAGNDRVRNRALFLTFSRAAVNEIAERVPGVLSGPLAGRIEIRTFHGFAVSVLDAFGRYAGRGTAPVSIVTDAEADLGLVRPGGVRYRELIPAATDLLRRSAWVRRGYLRRYGVVLSDEYQDTADDAAELLDLLATETPLVCLADPRQLIHAYLGEGREQRVERFQATADETIDLGDASHRDSTMVIPRLAAALADRDLASRVVSEALAEGRLRVLPPAGNVLAVAAEEARRLRRDGARSVGIFVAQRWLVDELASLLTANGVPHEIAGLDDAAGEAEAAVAALARFAAGTGSWATVLERLAVYLKTSQRGKDLALPRTLIRSPETLPPTPRSRLDAVRTRFEDGGGLTVREFLADVRQLWPKLLLGGSPRLWEIGVDDLRGQVVADADTHLRETADRLAEVAAERRAGATTLSFTAPRQPIRLMTRHQAKGREVDAVVYVQHEVEHRTPVEPDRDRRVFFTTLTRARTRISIVLPDPPVASFLGMTQLVGLSDTFAD